MPPARLLLPLALAAALPAVAHAQRSLAEALRLAGRDAYAVRAADAVADAERARTLAPLRGILPSARLEAGFLRTTDPIGAFGTTLRQRAVTPAAFDPARLNFPAPADNHVAAAVAEVPLVNLDAWVGRRAASRAADASEAQAAWTRLGTRADVVRAWYGAVLAVEKARTLEAAASAAAGHLAQAQAMVRQGMVTKADALLAAVRAGEVDVQLVEARGAARTAARQLALALGRPDAVPELPGTLPDAARIRAVVAVDTLDAGAARRADVDAAELGRDAARADALRARAALLPRVNSFARYDWNDAGAPFGGERNWTVGVMASFNLLTSATDVADLRAAASRRAAADAGAEAARARARLEADETRIALVVALHRLAIAGQGAAQAAEAHRLVEKRYAGGLATVAELLDAQATATGSALAESHARWGAIAAAAARRQALGADPGALAALEDGTPDTIAGTTP